MTYTYGGTNASLFSYNATTRQLTVGTGANLNHESQSTYTVTLTASDGSASAVLTVTIRVTDEDEPPSTPGAPTVNTVSGSDSVLRVTWSAPSNTGKPRITSYDLQYKRTTTSSWSNGPQNVIGTSRSITGLMANTSYQVRVRATNHEGDSPWSSPGTGMTDMEPLRLTSPGNLSFVVDRAISPPVTLPEATGGQGTRTYQITPTLPLGMRFNASTRELDGTPTVLQGFQTYNYQVTDSSGSDTETFRIAITGPMLTAPTVGERVRHDRRADQSADAADLRRRPGHGHVPAHRQALLGGGLRFAGPVSAGAAAWLLLQPVDAGAQRRRLMSP